MSNGVRPIPEGYHSLTPYLIVKKAEEAIDFYMRAFGGVELLRLEGPGGSIAHAEVKIGDSPLMLADEHPEYDALSPETVGGSPISLMIYVEDVDSSFERAVNEGATIVQPVEDQFYGDRSGRVKDPFGYTWTLATHIEDLSQEEINERMQAMMSGDE
ncbi:MAG: VOC family protein [Planctomycetaceae bacterium]|nr:VOC family protein [Planctomycetaceae bacterium]